MIKANLLSGQIYDQLLLMVWNGEMAPGSWLREVELATRLGVSRTPLREALKRFAAYGLAELKPHHGVQLLYLTRKDVIHLFQVRIALEGWAIKLACPRLSSADFAHLDSLSPKPCDENLHDFKARCFQFGRELHSMIAQRCGNAILTQEIIRLHDFTHLAPRGGLAQPGRRIQGLDEHLRILAALKARDQLGSKQAMRDHLCSLRKDLIRACGCRSIPAGGMSNRVDGNARDANGMA